MVVFFIFIRDMKSYDVIFKIAISRVEFNIVVASNSQKQLHRIIMSTLIECQIRLMAFQWKNELVMNVRRGAFSIYLIMLFSRF